MTPKRIDLNADMGESYGAFSVGDDEALMRIVSSANVACGFHAGDATIMHRLAALARVNGVALGAHPGFDDLWGFGRREIAMQTNDLEYLVAYQIGALEGIARYAEVPLRHVKPHGALYAMAAVKADYAEAIARAVKTVNGTLSLFGPQQSELEIAARNCGLAFAREAFCDRRYCDDGRLVTRGVEGAVIGEPAAAAAQAVAIVKQGMVSARSGKRIPLIAETLCIHGDEPGAIGRAIAVRTALEREGFIVAAFTGSI